MAGIQDALKNLFGRKGDEGYKPADIYCEMRERVLALDPASVGLTQSEPNQVWGALMETGYAKAVSTLVMLGDGTVSLYFSNGGGIIGLGQHEGPRNAGLAFLAAAPSFLQYAEPTGEYPLPQKSHTRFYLLTYEGIFTAEAPESDLGYGRHPLSPLFAKAQDVITQARFVSEKPQQ